MLKTISISLLATVSSVKVTVPFTVLPIAPAVVMSVKTTDATLLGSVGTEKSEAETTKPSSGVIVISPDVIMLLKNIESPFTSVALKGVSV